MPGAEKERTVGVSKRGTITIVAAALTAAALGTRLARRAATRRPRRVTGQRRRLVIAGAGFAGTSLVGRLAREIEPGTLDVLLIDRHNYHLFAPLLYQAATGDVDPANIAYPLRPFTAEHHADFLCASITGINLVDQVIETDQGNVDYDYLVLGLGSTTNFFGMQEVERRAHSLKEIPAARAIRNDLVNRFEQAARIDDPEERRRLLSFIVVGAGATGVELVGSLHELIQRSLLPYSPTLPADAATIVLVEATDTILPGMKQQVRDITVQRFAQLGIDLRLHTAIAGIDDNGVVTRSGETIPGRTVIWTAGVKPNPVVAALAVEKSRDGRVIVDEHLRVPDHPNVFALGDNAFALSGQDGAALPPNAQVAVQQGEATAVIIARLLAGDALLPFRYHHRGELVALGRWHAAADLGPVVFDGPPAWVAWRAFYLSQIMGIKNRSAVFLDWVSTLFARRYIANIES